MMLTQTAYHEPVSPSSLVARVQPTRRLRFRLQPICASRVWAQLLPPTDVHLRRCRRTRHLLGQCRQQAVSSMLSFSHS